MGQINQTRISVFFLMGLSQDSEQEPILFGLFLSIFVGTVLGNLLVILAISSDYHLHTHMYFFFSNLSFADTCFSSTTIPKMLVNLWTQNKAIAYADCITQMYFFMVFGGMDTFLLTVMAYDWFVAICHPLHYPHLCGLLVLMSWFISLTYSLIQSLLILQLSFCTDSIIQHFYCELAQVYKLACSNTLVNHILIYVLTSLLGIVPFSGIFFSCTQIVSTILRIPSAAGKCKAFSTCGSHMTVVSLFFGTGLGTYFSSETSLSSWKGMITTVMYTMVTPKLNPFIYSLQNKDIKKALQRVFRRTFYIL